MSDLHQMPLRGHDMPFRPAVRAKVFRRATRWYWAYQDGPNLHLIPPKGMSSVGPLLRHGPFASWREAYDSARRMVELL